MNDVIVSIRIPKPLLSEIKRLVEKGYYMDTSEGIRSIVRDSWTKFENPELEELKKLREDIKKELKKKTEKIIRREVIEELEKIKEMIKEESLSK